MNKLATMTLSTLVGLGLFFAAPAHADNNFGIGAKAGTLGFGVEGTWRALPWFDVRVGANRYDYDRDDFYSGIPYSGTLSLDTLYGTANFRFPLSPFRVTAGLYNNGNELNLSSSAPDGTYNIGGIEFDADDVGTLTSTTSFQGTAPYLGFGYDFTVMNKVGLNLDFGVLWQGDPVVTMSADGPIADQPLFQDALEAERQELEDDVSDFKAWPVISLGFVYNFM